MAFLFIPNPKAAAELAADPEITKGIAEAAEPARAAAEGYANSIMPRPGATRQVEVVQADEGVFITNLDYGAHLDEFGSVNNPPYAPLRRGVLAAGFELTETPKP